MTPAAEPALRIRCDRAALQANYRWFAGQAGVPAAAAVKADAYGTGAAGAVPALIAAGCRQFLVSSWAEALALPPDTPGILVLHGYHPMDRAAATVCPAAAPVLNTACQVRDWAAAFPGRPADLMVDTGMNRLGVAATDVAAAIAAGPIGTIHSHLACADTPDHPLNARQLGNFRALASGFPTHRFSLANSAAICLGPAWSFDAVRPGIGLYGGRPHPAAPAARVATPEARVIQLRTVQPGDQVGYGATFTATRVSSVAILNIGYADGVPRALAPHLAVLAGAHRCPLAGRISMDMIAVDVTGAGVGEGDWLALDWDLATLSAATTLSDYELLTGLSRRAPRVWQ